VRKQRPSPQQHRLGCALALRNKPRVLKGERTLGGETAVRESRVYWMVGRNFEASPNGAQIAWKEEGGSILYRHPGQTLERKNPRRVSARWFHGFGSTGDDVVGGSNPLKRPVRTCGDRRDRGENGDAGGAVSWFELREVPPVSPGWKSHEGKADREVTSLSDDGQALKGEPQERCVGPKYGVLRQVERGARRHRRANVKGAMGRGWQPGAVADAAGRFVRLVRAEGERNPMGGGVKVRLDRAGHAARSDRLTGRHGSYVGGDS
jgi:hypothetical protein